MRGGGGHYALMRRQGLEPEHVWGSQTFLVLVHHSGVPAISYYFIIGIEYIGISNCTS